MKSTRKPGGRKALSAKQEDTSTQPQVKVIGATVYFRPGDHAHAERTLADLRALGVAHVRIALSPADWRNGEEAAWYEWLIPAIAQQAELLPCLVHTAVPQEDGAEERQPADIYRDFLEQIVTRFAGRFTWIELSIDPDGRSGWDALPDAAWSGLCKTIGEAALWAREQGKKTVFTVGTQCAPGAFARLCSRDVLSNFDAVGVYDPGAAAHDHERWRTGIGQLRTLLGAADNLPQVWITDTGFSTHRYNDYRQLHALLDTVDAPADRIYWRAALCLDGERAASEEPPTGGGAYHMGLRRADGAPTLLFRLLQDGGMEGIRSTLRLADRPVPVRDQPGLILITGGAGSVGSSLADRLLSMGEHVLVYDNLARPGAEHNLRRLFERHREGLEFQLADVRNRPALRRALRHATQVYHLAAQPALGASLHAPIEDYEVNSCGTLNLLEELRLLDTRPPLVFTSTNKVYGALAALRLKKEHSRYEPEDRVVRHNGVAEEHALDFRSPYACSKGAAEQYVLNYAKTYGLPALVLRVGSVYGAHQTGRHDHDWVAHFVLQTLLGEPITLHGDGLQVRDILHMDDFVEALLLAQRHMAAGAGQAFNIGGGPGNTVSLLEIIDLIEIVHGGAPVVRHQDWRTDDQRYYVSNVSKFAAMTGWTPQVDVGDGIRRLYRWLAETALPAGEVEGGRAALR